MARAGVRSILRFFLWSALVVAAFVVGVATLLAVFVYSPAPEVPRLTGTLTQSVIEAGGLTRIYRLYVPRGLARGSPLVVAMHGSGMSGAQLRIETGYAFERLADQYGFAVVYPNAHEGYWNACNIVGNAGAAGREVDDVAFLTALAEKLMGDIGADPARVFATGISRGGAMAFRLALEAPSRFRAVAAVASNVPAPQNFKCKPAETGTSSVMIMNGTEDPIVPFDGGEVALFGLFYKNGPVLSARASAQYFAGLNHIAVKPEVSETQVANGVRVERVRWHGTHAEVELVAVHGGGHSLPQPYRRAPRLLGPSPVEPHGPALIWAFFARQVVR